jgi:hypothetical protein
MTISRLIWPKRAFARIAVVAVLIVVGYFASALAVLDFSDIAYPNDEEYFNDRQVAFGPRPRWFLCTAVYPSFPAGWSYDGSEWALVIYRPICEWWAVHKGFALPSRWRKE